jgi:hypothetical protein
MCLLFNLPDIRYPAKEATAAPPAAPMRSLNY